VPSPDSLRSALGVLLFLAIMFLPAVAHVARRRAGRAGGKGKLRSYAARHGYEFTAHDAYDVAHAGLPLLERGRRRRCHNLVAGNREGLPFVAGNYTYYEHEVDERGYSQGNLQANKHLAVVIGRLAPHIQLPWMVITRRVVPALHGDHKGLRQLLVGWEPFDRRFQLEVYGELPAHVLRPALLEHLLASAVVVPAPFRWETGGSQLLVASAPYNQPEEDMLAELVEPLLAAAKGFADHLVAAVSTPLRGASR
jgi:hypothetical protein